MLCKKIKLHSKAKKKKKLVNLFRLVSYHHGFKSFKRKANKLKEETVKLCVKKMLRGFINGWSWGNMEDNEKMNKY